MKKGRSSQRQQFKCKCTFHKHVINFACPIKGKIENVSRTQPPRQRGETNRKPLRGLQYSEKILHLESCFGFYHYNRATFSYYIYHRVILMQCFLGKSLIYIFLHRLQAKRTPLHMAAQSGQMEVCSTLLNMKADANATDVVRSIIYNQMLQMTLLINGL